MSLEMNIERIADALESIATSLNNTPVVAAEPKTPPEPAPEPEPAAPTPPPAPAPAASTVPFTDLAGLNQYVMSAYTEMGAEKGAKIAGVLQSIGVNNVKEIKPEQFEVFYNGVEALKAS